GGNDGGGVNTRGISRRLGEKFNGTGECKVGIVAAEESEKSPAGFARDGNVVVDENGRSARRFEEREVAPVRGESDLTSLSFFESRDAVNFGIGTSGRGRIETAIESCCDVRQLHRRCSCQNER